jgi:hypothetical protein
MRAQEGNGFSRVIYEISRAIYIAGLHFDNIATEVRRCEERVNHDEIEKATGDPAQIPDGGR